MCELFGFTAKKEEQINKILIEFFTDCEYHPHGWGAATIENNKTLIKKEPVKAIMSEYLVNRLAKPIITKNLIAHIRYATIGCTNIDNCHPFTKKDNNNKQWTLIHNGTVFSYLPLDKFTKTQKGETDSERILLHIIDEINKNAEKKKLNIEDYFNIIDNIISKLTKGNKINLIVQNESYLYVHTNLEKTLFYQKDENHIIFATHPLSDKNWKQVPINTLFLFENGKLIKNGKKHNNEYAISEKDLEKIAELTENFKNTLLSAK